MKRVSVSCVVQPLAGLLVPALRVAAIAATLPIATAWAQQPGGAVPAPPARVSPAGVPAGTQPAALEPAPPPRWWVAPSAGPSRAPSPVAPPAVSPEVGAVPPLGAPPPPVGVDGASRSPDAVAPAPIASPTDAPAVPPIVPDDVAGRLPPPPPLTPTLISKAVPRALFLTVGWTYTPTNTLPLSSETRPQTTQGLTIDGGLLWQVRGFDGVSWPAWIGFMPSFFYYFGDQGQRDFLGLGYGIYVKHALWPGPRVRLFIAYGLGAAQVWVRGVDNRAAGHLTRLAVGADVRLKSWLQLTFEFSYRFHMLPTLKLEGSDNQGFDFHSLNLQAGLWFGR